MANLFETIFGKAVPKSERPARNWVKPLAIASGMLWVASLGAVYALKNINLSPADTHGKDAHDGDSHAEKGALHDVPAAARTEDQAAGDKPAGHHGDTGADHAHGGSQAAGSHAGDGHADASHAVAHAADSKENHHGYHEKTSPADNHAAGNAPAGGHDEEALADAAVSVDERSALRELAEIHASRGDLDRALKPILKLMRVPTEDVALLSLATEVYLGTGHYPEALATARKAHRHAAPGRVDLLVAAVMARYRLGEVGQALEEAAAAVKEHPKDIDLRMALATMEVEMGPGHKEYGKSLAQVLKMKPDHIPALYLLGRKSQLEGNYKDAETHLAKVLKKEPGHAKARAQLGMALYHLDRLPEAEREYQAALKANPKDYNTWFNLGELYLRMAGRAAAPVAIRARRSEAMAAFLKAVELNPEHAEAHYRAGVILNGNGQYKEAIRHLEAAREVDSHHVPTLVQLAVAYENLKRLDLAKAVLEKALELDPEDKVVLFKLKQMG